MPSEGGSAVPVTHGGGVYAEESWDGRYLYYTKTISLQGWGVWRVPVAGGEETEVVPQGALADLFGMALAREGPYYSRKTWNADRGVFTVLYLDFASGRVTEVLRRRGRPASTASPCPSTRSGSPSRSPLRRRRS
jgi:hypothetical protein